MKNLEDRKTLGGNMRKIIWERDNRRCKRCDCIVYHTQKPKGVMHHVNMIKEDNHVANLLLLCSNCKRDINRYNNSLWQSDMYIWEMEILTQMKQQSLRDKGNSDDLGYQHYRVTKLIDELEQENRMLSLLKRDLYRLKYLKELEQEMCKRHKKAEEKEI